MMAFWVVIFLKRRSERMVFYHCLVVERRECVGRALSAFVLFRLEIRILIWRNGVPVFLV